MPGFKPDDKNLSKKYRTNVTRLIRAWKKGMSDSEVSRFTGVDPVTLYHIRSDIEIAHRRMRLARKKDNLGLDQTAQHHIFLSPLT